MNKGYMDTLKDTALKGKKNYTGTFYVVVLTKRERLIEKTLRNIFMQGKRVRLLAMSRLCTSSIQKMSLNLFMDGSI